MKLNTKTTLTTHEGGKTNQVTTFKELERAVLSCMLWESQFYESGESITDRITKLVAKCNPNKVLELAVKARNDFKLRHVPLLLIVATLKSHKGVKVVDTIYEVIQRPDELSEILAIYWKDGKVSIANQLKKGLAKAFNKFNAYQLQKYNRDGAIKLRDVLFLCHAKPVDAKQESTWKLLVEGKLPTPDTWETQLSAGNDKKEVFTRLITENKLGYLALLRNLRNMTQAGVPTPLIKEALLKGNKDKILPFRFIPAAKYAPGLEDTLDKSMLESLASQEKLKGATTILVDVSGSMEAQLSSKSDLTRLDAASALAVLVREICEDVQIFTFSTKTVEVPNRHGMALIEAINRSQSHGGTYLGQSLRHIKGKVDNRIIVITDEQTSDSITGILPKGLKKYMINVASYKNTICYGDWVSITGFSEKIVDYIQSVEELE